jgi:hypothetical protein
MLFEYASNAVLRSRGEDARVARRLTLETEGAGNAGCTLHRRSRVQICAKKAHTSIQVQRRHPAFPAQWLYGLCRALPGDRIRLVTVAAGLMADRIRLDRSPHRQLGTSNGCRDHTVLPYANSAVRPACRRSLTENRPANTCAPDAAASTTSHPAFRDDHDTPLLSGETGKFIEVICPTA